MKRRVIYTLALILILIITVGFARVKNISMSKEFSVPISNLKVEEATNKDNLEITNNKEGLAYNVELEKPGDYYSFTLDLTNKYNKKAKIENISIPKLTERQKRYLDYQVTYLDGRIIKQGDIINPNTKETIKITIYFKEDITVEDLPENDEQLDLGLDIKLVPTD